MAKKLEAKQLELKLIPKAEAARLLKSQNEIETQISELRGQMGNQMTQSAARYGTNAAAFRIAKRYARKPAAQAADFYVQLSHFWQMFEVGKEVAPPAKRRPGRPKKAADNVVPMSATT